MSAQRDVGYLHTTNADPVDRETLAGWLEAVAGSRDRTAFSHLFAYFAPRLKGYLLRLGSDPALAEEIVQDVMLTVWRKADQFDRRQAAASTWLFTIARNRRIDIARRNRQVPLDPEEPGLAPTADPLPDERLAAGQESVRLHDAMTVLPLEQRDLIDLAFFKGLSHRQIADRTGIALGTVKSRLRLAFQRLRVTLDTDPKI